MSESCIYATFSFLKSSLQKTEFLITQKNSGGTPSQMCLRCLLFNYSIELASAITATGEKSLSPTDRVFFARSSAVVFSTSNSFLSML